jgi:opacity protein-like surface antigen
MKKVFFVVGLLLVNSLAFAQGVNPNYSSGSKAMLFTFDGLSTLRAGNFEGGIGAKYFLGQKMALRAALQFASSSEDIPANAAAGQQATDGEQSGTQFGVSAALELHLGARRANPYLGGGLSFSTTSTESTNPVIGPSSSQTKVENNDIGENVNGRTFLGGTTLGVFALAGVEFFLINEVSLAAEYRLGISKISRADEKITLGNQTQTTQVGGGNDVGINNSGLLTLAVYF